MLDRPDSAAARGDLVWPRPHLLRHRRRYGGLAGVLGGVAWAVWVVLGERRPPCCSQGVENEFLPYEWSKLAAYALIAVAAATVATGAAGRLSLGSRAGAGLVAVGGALGTASLAAEAAGFVLDRPFPEIAALVLLIPAGTVLLGAGALTRRDLPRPVAVGLLLGGAMFYAGNSETKTMLLWSVLGIAWALCGLFVASAREGGRAQGGRCQQVVAPRLADDGPALRLDRADT